MSLSFIADVLSMDSTDERHLDSYSQDQLRRVIRISKIKFEKCVLRKGKPLLVRLDNTQDCKTVVIDHVSQIDNYDHGMNLECCTVKIVYGILQCWVRPDT